MKNLIDIENKIFVFKDKNEIVHILDKENYAWFKKKDIAFLFFRI